MPGPDATATSRSSSGARRVAGNPTVQAAATKAQDTVTQQAPVVRRRQGRPSAASTVKDKVTDTFGRDDHVQTPHPASPAGPAVS